MIAHCRVEVERYEAMADHRQWAESEEFSLRKIAAEFGCVATSIDGSELHWISRDLCEVVGQTYGKVPDWSPSQVLPGESGLVLFERSPGSPVRFDDAPETAVAVDALCWVVMGGRVLVTILTRGSIIHSAAQDLDPSLGAPPLYSVYTLNLDPDVPQGAGKVSPEMITGTDTVMPAYQTTEDEMDEVLSLVGTTWLLMGQTGVTQSVSSTPPPTSRARKAAARGEDVPEVVITEHRLSRSMAAGQRSGSGSGRTATTRWWVRGHWRQQACGPGRTQRRPVYIAPHTAGAAGADVDPRPRVHRHRA